MAKRKTTRKTKTMTKRTRSNPLPAPINNPCEKWTEVQLSVVNFGGVEVDTMTAYYVVAPIKEKWGKMDINKLPMKFLDDIVNAMKTKENIVMNRTQAYTGWVHLFSQYAMIQKKMFSQKGAG